MGVIKINNIIYGSNLASDIIYKNTTVEEKLNAIPVFDPSDNINIEDAKYDYLTYGHIINHLESDAADKVLSAKQGKELKNYIDNIDLSYLENDISNNAEDIELLNSNLEKVSNKVNILEQEMTDNEVITDLDNRVAKNTTDIAQLNANSIRYNKETDKFDIYIDGVLYNSLPAGVNAIGLVPILNVNDGKVIASSQYANSTFYPWKAFNNTANDSGDCWITKNGTTTGQWIGYKFGREVIVKKVFLKNRAGSGLDATGVRAITSFTLQGSTDYSNWFNIQSFNVASASIGAEQMFEVTNWQKVQAARLYITGTATSEHCAIAKLQFYGN